MAVKIRLRKQGRTNRQTFRLVACESRVKRDGKYLENLGWYDPALKENNAKIKEERALFWLSQGAEMTEDAKNLIAREAPGVIKHWTEQRLARQKKLAEKRKARRKKAEKAAPAPKEAAAPKKKAAAPKKTAKKAAPKKKAVAAKTEE